MESGEIVFRGGKVVAAFRTGSRETVGEGMLELGVLSPQAYQDLLASQSAGRIGRELFGSTDLDNSKIEEALEELLKRIIYAMFDWAEGTFSFVLEDKPETWRGFTLDGTRVVCERGLSPQYLAIEGARLRDERTKDDELESFLSRGQPSAEEKLGQSSAGAERLLGALQPSEEVVAGPASLGPAPQPSALQPDANVGPTHEPPTPAPSPAPTSPTPPHQGPPPPAVPESEKVIPFPGGRVRRETGHQALAVATVEEAREQEPEPEPEPSPAAAPAEVTPSNAAAPHALLVVDDDPLVTEQIKTAFLEKFSSVTAVQVVADAAQVIAEKGSDLVVATDLIIARSDGRGILGGVQVLEEARQHSVDIPVVLFSDYQNEEAEQKARSLGVAAVLMKPRKAQIHTAVQGGKPTAAMQSFLAQLGAVLEPYCLSAGTQRSREPAAEQLSAAGQEEAHPEPRTEPTVGSQALEPPTAQPSAAQPTPSAPLPAAESPAAATVADPTEPVAVPQPPPLVTPIDLRREIVSEVGDLGTAVEQDLPPPVISAGEMGTLRSMLAELIDPANRETVTLLVLRYASHIMERSALFLATRRAYVGLGGFSHDEDSERFVGRVRRIQIPVELKSIFARVSHYRAMIREPLERADGNQSLIDGIGGGWPSKVVVAAPLISGSRVAAILYGDNPSGVALGATDSLEIFLQQAGLAMDRALLERKLEETRRKPGDRQ